MSVNVVKCHQTLRTSNSNPHSIVFRLNQWLIWHMFFPLSKFEFRLTSENIFNCQWMSILIQETSSLVRKTSLMSTDMWAKSVFVSILINDVCLWFGEIGEIGFYRKWTKEKTRYRVSWTAEAATCAVALSVFCSDRSTLLHHCCCASLHAAACALLVWWLIDRLLPAAASQWRWMHCLVLADAVQCAVRPGVFAGVGCSTCVFEQCNHELLLQFD